MGSCCCCKKQTKVEDKDKKIKKKDMPKPKSRLFKHDIKEESMRSDKRLITDEKLAEEERQTFKAGDSAYAKQKNRKKKLKYKSLSDLQYNIKGLVDEHSKEYQTVKHFLRMKNYELICSIGSGNYAEVYKAYSSQFKKNVAVKVIQLTKENANYRLEFLPREVDILKECKHPNIIKIYELNQTQNKVYMIMEFAQNGTFGDWLKDRGALTESTAHTMFTKVLGALHHMHSRRIAHRDLKLENILITAQMNPKISDFSFAVKVDPNNPKNTTHCGSLPYFAPELLRRQPYDPLISDIWSLGVCFYILLNDGLPFKLGDDRLMLKKQLNRDWKFKSKVESQISPELKSMIKKMLEPDIRARVTTTQLIENPWIKNFADKH